MKTILAYASPLLFTASLRAQEQAESSLWSMIQQGGWAMIPLAITCLALLYLAVHCYLETRSGTFANETFAQKIERLFQNRDLAQASAVSQQEPSAFGRAIAAALSKYDPQRHDDSIEAYEQELGAVLELEENAIAQWIHYLSVIANVAPMIGLLGTVSGMIGGFQTMSAGGMGRPELFAGDIGEALITTATGLCIGIPAMIAHSYFSNKLNTQVVEAVRRANQVSEALPKA